MMTRCHLMLLFLAVCAHSASVTVDLTKAQMHTSRNYLSVTIDSGAFVYANKWALWEAKLEDETLVELVGGMAPGYLRIGGTPCDVVRYNMSAGACAESVEPPGGYTPQAPFMLTRCRWEKILEWAKKTHLPVLFGLNVLSDRPEGQWDPTNAEELISFTEKYHPGVVRGWELGNEPEGWVRNFNMSVSNAALAQDFHVLRKALGSEAFLVGPDYGIQGCISKGYGCTTFIDLVGRLAEGGGAVNMSTFHFYNLGNTDVPAEFLVPSVLDRTRTSVETGVQANQKAVQAAPVWVGEGATASGGGVTNASGTYTATFLWMDKLGSVGRFGGSGLMRQSLFGGRYALLDPETFIPRPTYWVALLFKRLTAGSNVVLAVDGDTEMNRTLRIYARCSDAEGSVIVFGTNLNADSTNLTFSPMLSAAPAREDYVLTGTLGSGSIALNGKTMTLNGGKLPNITGASVPPNAPLMLSGQSSFMTVFRTVPEAKAVCAQ